MLNITCGTFWGRTPSVLGLSLAVLVKTPGYRHCTIKPSKISRNTKRTGRNSTE